MKTVKTEPRNPQQSGTESEENIYFYKLLKIVGEFERAVSGATIGCEGREVLSLEHSGTRDSTNPLESRQRSADSRGRLQNSPASGVLDNSKAFQNDQWTRPNPESTRTIVPVPFLPHLLDNSMFGGKDTRT
jgi:hypothetical protein